MKSIAKYSALLIAGLIFLNACSKKPDVENTSTVAMAGEWFIEYFDDSAPNTPLTPHTKLLTYNTSDPNSNKIWVEDHDVWTFKAKFDVNYANRTFTLLNSTPNLDDATETIKVYEGKVLANVAKSKSGNIVDSIFMRVEFSHDPGTIYQIRGHFRTGFFEDEY
jgi:hypothetical protein